jgi:hypothetical protein
MLRDGQEAKMPKQEPLKYRLISQHNLPEIPGISGDRTYDRTFVLCLSSGHHATISLENFVEFRSLKTLPLDLADKIRFTPCDCCRHTELAPPWLAEALIKHQAERRRTKPSRAKPKKRPTMGR